MLPIHMERDSQLKMDATHGKTYDKGIYLNLLVNTSQLASAQALEWLHVPERLVLQVRVQ